MLTQDGNFCTMPGHQKISTYWLSLPLRRHVIFLQKSIEAAAAHQLASRNPQKNGFASMLTAASLSGFAFLIIRPPNSPKHRIVSTAAAVTICGKICQIGWQLAINQSFKNSMYFLLCSLLVEMITFPVCLRIEPSHVGNWQ